MVTSMFLSMILLSAASHLPGLTDDSAWSKLSGLFAAPEQYKGDMGSFKSYLQFSDGRPVTTRADWQKRRAEIRREWMDMLGQWPPLISKPAIKYLGDEHVENFTRRKVDVEIAPGRTASGYILIPDGKGRRPAVLDVFYTAEDGAGLSPDKRQQNDFGYQLAKRGFVALCIGLQPWLDGPIYYPDFQHAQLQPLSYLAYVAANCHTALTQLQQVDSKRIGIVGHSYGGKWAMFAGCLYDKFAAVAVSDPGIVFDETRSNVNYWEPWYLGYEPGVSPRKAGIPDEKNPRSGPYKRMMETGRDLHELQALLAPRPFFVAGGSEDKSERWRALNHLVALNRLMGYDHRVGMANRPDHKITPKANEQICLFFQRSLSANDSRNGKH